MASDTECSIVEVPATELAVSEITLAQSDIPAKINRQFDIVYQWLKQAAVQQTGHNYALYDQFSSDGMRMRTGFPVSGKFNGNDLVHCLQLPAMRAAHARHYGSYARLGETHRALNIWCDSRKLQRKPLSWEVYGDWFDDESQLVTDIYIAVI